METKPAKILDPVEEILQVTEPTDANRSTFYYPATAQAEVQNAFTKIEEKQLLDKLHETFHSDPCKNQTSVARWQGAYIWAQGPRGAGRTTAMEKRIRACADQAPEETMLYIGPYNRMAEQWRLWAQENKINLETHVPESFAHSIVSAFYRELGYDRPPEWANQKMKRIVRGIWEEMQNQMDSLIEHMDERKEIKIGHHMLAISHVEKKPTNALQYAGTIQNEFFARITRLFKDEAAINTDLANYMLKALLESRTDLRNMLSRKYNALFLEEPETMDREFFEWFPLIKFQSIFATSIYSIKSKRGMYPWLESHWSNPDGREANPNFAFFGVPVRTWRETYVRTVIRGRYSDSIRMVSDQDNRSVKVVFNKEIADRMTREDLWPKARTVQLTLEPESAELRAGVWLSQNILRYHNAKTEHLRALRVGLDNNVGHEAPMLVRPKKRVFDLASEMVTLQVFLALPHVTNSAHPDIEHWRDYLTGAFPALQDLNLDVRYLALSDGPVETPTIERKPETFGNTVWIGTPLALNGCEFDIVIIPALEEDKWPKAESTSWDWLDLCVSKARFATLALARKERLISPVRKRLPVSFLNERLNASRQGKLYFEPLYRPQPIADLFGPPV